MIPDRYGKLRKQKSAVYITAHDLGIYSRIISRYFTITNPFYYKPRLLFRSPLHVVVQLLYADEPVSEHIRRVVCIMIGRNPGRHKLGTLMTCDCMGPSTLRLCEHFCRCCNACSHISMLLFLGTGGYYSAERPNLV